MTSKHLVAETQRQTERYAQGWFPVDLEAIDPVVREKREIEHLRAFASKGKEAGGEGGLTSVGFFMSHLRALVMIRYQGTWTGRARVPGNRGREVTADD